LKGRGEKGEEKDKNKARTRERGRTCVHVYAHQTMLCFHPSERRRQPRKQPAKGELDSLQGRGKEKRGEKEKERDDVDDVDQEGQLDFVSVSVWWSTMMTTAAITITICDDGGTCCREP
jgi:hypothetical protein